VATLHDVRKLFIKLSGREDLATTTTTLHDTDAGADEYINAGQRYLDGLMDNPDSNRLYEVTTQSGTCYVDIPDGRSVQNVFVRTTEDEFQKLYNRTLSFLLEEYPKFELTDVDFPTDYCLYPNRTQGRSLTIAILPPADDNYTVRIFGKFYSPWLTNNSDTSFWTNMYKMTLVHAALFMLEGSYRNTEGATDWRALVMESLGVMDKDVVEQEMPNDPII